MDITDCKIIELPKIVDPRGNLSIIEQLKQIPFEIKWSIGYMMCPAEWIVENMHIKRTRNL